MHLALSGLCVRHPAARAGALAIDAVSFAVQRGERVAVIGPSGAGKTTLLHALACAMPPLAGRFDLMDTQPWALPRKELHRLRARLFLAPQTPPLPPRQRVVTAVLAGRLPQMGFRQSLGSLWQPRELEAAHAALAAFDLAGKLFDRVDRLSGGERQRVGLARALVSNAELLLIDEPLSALDPTRAREAINTLCSAARERGATLIASLHQVEVARSAFERIVALRDGRMVFDLPAGEVDDALLRALYADHEDELAVGWLSKTPVAGGVASTDLQRQMACR